MANTFFYMLEHYKGDEVFVKKILDYKYQAEYNQRLILTPFLNPHEQELVYTIIGNQLKVESSGGILESENQRVIICPDFYELMKEDFEITVVEIIYNQQFGRLKHKDVLGALMNLGIKRECIGDIYDGERLIFTCTSQSYQYISEHLKQIKRSKVNLRIIEDDIEIKREYISKVFFVSSLRLDKLVSAFYKISRQQASEAIRSGSVKVNHKVIEQVDKLCHNNDVISFKKHGRVVLKDENKQSKQGNLVVTGLFYK